jgi:hypothetical protein
MKVHRACSDAAEWLVWQRAAGMGYPVTAWNMFKSLTFCISGSHGDVEGIHPIARSVTDNNYRVLHLQPLGGRPIERDVISHSFRLWTIFSLERALRSR